MLLSGEPGLDTTNSQWKVGDGVTTWNSLSFWGQGPTGPGVPVGGSALQALRKINGTNYNTEWFTLNAAGVPYAGGPTLAATDVEGALDELSTEKVDTTRSISTTAPLTGGGDLSANRTFAISAATQSAAGSFAALDKKKLDTGYKDIVTDFGADPTGAVDAKTIIQTAVDSFGTAGGRIYFPPGTYLMTGTVTISKPVILFGAGRSISNITINHATQDQFVMATGAAGSGFEQIRLTGDTPSRRTGGSAVNFGAIANVYMQQCDILFHHTGVTSGGPLQFLDDLNIREMGANAAAGQCVLINSTGDRYIRRLTTDNPSDPTGFASIRVRECSSLVISDCNLINGTNALDIVPNAGIGHAVASILVNNTFFDSSVIGCNIVPASANDTAHRIRFTNCWFSTCTTAGVVINHANVNSVDFVGCDFYQNPFGIDALACTEWSVRSSRFAGNTTNAIRTTAGATHSFTISDNFIGNGAGFGANAQGINIQAGTYKRYQIFDNRGLESNTTPGFIELGVVGATDQKNVSNNMGVLPSDSIATLGADVASSGTAQIALITARIPANAVRVGDTFRIRLSGNSSSTGTLAFKVKAGTNGTAADGDLVTTATSVAQVANHRSHLDALVKVKAIGAGGTVQAEAVARYSNVFVEENPVAAPIVLARDTTVAWFITVSVACSVGTFTATTAAIEVV